MPEFVRFRLKPDKWIHYGDWFQTGRVYTGRRDDVNDRIEADNGYVVSWKDAVIDPSPEPVFEIHQSDIEALWSCPRRFYLQSILGLKTLVKPSYFTVGEIFHFAVATMRHPINHGRFPGLEHRHGLTLAQVAKKFASVDGKLMTESMNLFDKWLDKERKDPLKHKVFDVELPLTYRNDSWPEGIYIGGTLDSVLIDHMSDTKVWIGEEKTAGRADIGYFRSLKNGPQPAWYYTLLLHNLPHLGLSKVETIRGHYYEICQKSVSGDPVRREMSILDDSMFQRGLEFITNSVDRYANMVKVGHYPRVLTSCYGKFNTECPYMSWCYRGGDEGANHTDLLGTMYEIKSPKLQLKERQPHIDEYILPKEEADGHQEHTD